MKPLSNNTEYFFFDEWFCIKLSLLVIWMGSMVEMVVYSSSCPFPVGICKLYSFNPLFSTCGRGALILVLCVFCALYLFERKMLYTTFGMFVFSLIIISHKESNGVMDRATLFTTIYAAQFFAYFRYKLNSGFNINHFRIQYCVQIIAATYMLSAISKLQASGLSWIDGGATYPVQVVKNASFAYFTTGIESHLQRGYAIAYALLAQKHVVKLLLATSLVLELTCFLSIFNKRMRIAYGIGLTLMHLGIYLAMDIFIIQIAAPMVIFYLNPVYWIKVRVQKRYVFCKINL